MTALNRFRLPLREVVTGGICLLALLVSLVAALVTRFLWMMFVARIQSPAAYEDFVGFSVLAFENAILPVLTVGAVVFYLFRRIRRPNTLAVELLSVLVVLTVFFGAMGAIGLLLDESVTFPRETWALAWIFSVFGFSAFLFTRKLDSTIKQNMLFNRANQIMIDFGVIGLAFYLAYLLRFDGAPPAPNHQQFLLLLPYLMLLQVGVNYLWGVYSFIWRFTGLREVLVILQSVASVALISLILRIVAFEAYPAMRVPFGVLLMFPIFTYIGFCGVRALRRVQHGRASRRKHRHLQGPGPSKRLLIAGAGRAAQLLLRELENRADFEVIGFLDDDQRKNRRVIGGIKVLGATKDLASVAAEKRVSEVTLCMPNASASAVRRIVADCERLAIRVSTIPALSEIMLGKVTIGQLQPVRMEDLLGRDTIDYISGDTELLKAYRGKRLLITGAGGSIGAELARQLKEFSPSELILLDKDENSLYEIGLEIKEDFGGDISEVMADIRDKKRMEKVFERFRPEVVFHAAAYKHVPVMENHPAEAILNNVFGTRALVDLSALHAVDSFVLISTDKAVNPTSVMGASKRIAEMIVQEKASVSSTTRFCCVRFGNVLGSRASVVPLFQKRISQGKSLKVTHPEVRRYFMTIPEAVRLVIQAGSLGRHGEIFVLDMGNPVKIVDLARELIELSGLVPGEDIKIEFTGLRPGEKLYEELLLNQENGIRSTKYPKIFVEQALKGSWAELAAVLAHLERAAREEDSAAIYRVFHALNMGYASGQQNMAFLAGQVAGKRI